jgi:hypothetical protein
MLRSTPPVASWLAVCGALALASGCGGRLGTAGRATPGVDAGADASGPSAAPCRTSCPPAAVRAVALPRPECPEVEPTPGVACGDPGLRCGYGGGRTPYCRTEYQCKGTWQSTARPLPGCPTPNREACPPTKPAAGDACVVGTLIDVPCEYGETSCRCGAGPLASEGDPGRWLCYGPPADTACPEIVPNVGEGCRTPGRECWYDPEGCLDARLYVTCRGGSWQPGDGPSCLR